jgi:pyruvate,orthophosphate dikinase
MFSVNGSRIPAGAYITVDGTTGEVFEGRIETTEPDPGPDVTTLMSWADEYRTVGVRTNADTPTDAAVARRFGAEGIGLCRTEHMFFEGTRIDAVREMIVADTVEERRHALNKIEEPDRRLRRDLPRHGWPPRHHSHLDPPLHEFLPHPTKRSSHWRNRWAFRRRSCARGGLLREAAMLGFAVAGWASSTRRSRRWRGPFSPPRPSRAEGVSVHLEVMIRS